MSEWRQDHYVTQRELEHQLEEIYERMDRMATQADVDAITAQVTQVATDLVTAQTNLQGEIDKLSQANPSVDVSALQGAVAPLDSAVQALGQLQPTPVVPPQPQ